MFSFSKISPGHFALTPVKYEQGERDQNDDKDKNGNVPGFAEYLAM